MSVADLFKTAATPTMCGRLVLSNSGWLLLEVPNAVGKGLFDSLNEPGTELPLSETTGQYKAHISVMRPEELEQIGGAQKVTERGRDFSYTLDTIKSFTPRGWPEMSKCWVMQIKSPELSKLRKTYGLSAIPHEGEYAFHITFATRRKHVLGANAVSKSRVDDNRKPVKFPWDTVGVQVVKAAVEKRTRTRTEEYEVCEHCNEEIREKSLYYDMEKGCWYHRPCIDAGPIKRAAAVDDAQIKHAAATLAQSIARAARRVVDPVSDAQAEAGNYRKGHINMHGLQITIETPKGAERSGTDSKGNTWSTEMQNHYGYIRRTEDLDGDHVDVFLGPYPKAELVYVVDQINPATKNFDEHKCMLGFLSLADARTAYNSNYEKNWKGLGKITPVTMQQFRTWLKDGSQMRPLSTQMFKIKAANEQSTGERSVMILQNASFTRVVPPDA